MRKNEAEKKFLSEKPDEILVVYFKQVKIFPVKNLSTKIVENLVEIVENFDKQRFIFLTG